MNTDKTSRRTFLAGVGTIMVGSGVASADHLGPDGETRVPYANDDESKTETPTNGVETETDGSTPTPDVQETPMQDDGGNGTPEPTETSTETSTPTPSAESQYPSMDVDVVADCHEGRVAVELVLTVVDHGTVYLGYDTAHRGEQFRAVEMGDANRARVSNIGTTDDIELLTERGYKLAQHKKDYSEEILARWEGPVECVGR